MKSKTVALILSAAALALGLNGCDLFSSSKGPKKLTPDVIHEATLNSIKDIINNHPENGPHYPLDSLSRQEFNHAALWLNLPVFWIPQETEDKELKPDNLILLRFYPDSDTFEWKNGKGGFTAEFRGIYDKMVAIVNDPDLMASSRMDFQIQLQVFDKYFDKGIEKCIKRYPDLVSAELKDYVAEGDKKQEIPSPDWDKIKEDVRIYIEDAKTKKGLTGGNYEEEVARLAKVREELNQAAITAVISDFSQSDENEKEFVKSMLKVGSFIDILYAKQVGIDKLMDRIPQSDSMSRSMIRRNWGLKAESPKMKNDKECRAAAPKIQHFYGIYPEELQKDPDFCAKLDARPDAETLLDHFSVIVQDGKNFQSVSYAAAFSEEMQWASLALTEAAEKLAGNAEEAALKKYLDAAAAAFLRNDWNEADEAWAAMNSTNSKWYVRVAPDETYWDPCSRHAGFHMTFARINPEALQWQEKLNPLQQDMEKEMAAIAGAPYKARKVSFHLPDFIDIVTNSGDDRDAFGATIGQSLPNWGPVANEGRGRTVAMSNLYTDPDSLRDRMTLASSMFTEKDLEYLKGGSGPGLLSTILHEAAHNLGPAHEYMVDGKKDNEVYGGALASMAEEFKAQTAALWYLPYLVKKKVIDQELADRSYADSVYWAFGHIARGMTDADGKIQPYSQLSAIQIGMMLEDGALVFDPQAKAANGTDEGAFIIDFEKMPASVTRIMKAITQSKARGDKEALVELQKKHVEGDGVPFKLIEERMQRLPKTSFVYSVKLD